jgi:hypothetical protein
LCQEKELSVAVSRNLQFAVVGNPFAVVPGENLVVVAGIAVDANFGHREVFDLENAFVQVGNLVEGIDQFALVVVVETPAKVEELEIRHVVVDASVEMRIAVA